MDESLESLFAGPFAVSFGGPEDSEQLAVELWDRIQEGDELLEEAGTGVINACRPKDLRKKGKNQFVKKKRHSAKVGRFGAPSNENGFLGLRPCRSLGSAGSEKLFS